MKVQYQVFSGGEIRIRNETGKTIILNPNYWAIKSVPENERYSFNWGVDPRSPTVEIPDDIFIGLHYGIRRYNKEGFRRMRKGKGKGMKGFDDPEVMKIKASIDSLESQLAGILEQNDPVGLEPYLFFQQIIPSSVTD